MKTKRSLLFYLATAILFSGCDGSTSTKQTNTNIAPLVDSTAKNIRTPFQPDRLVFLNAVIQQDTLHYKEVCSNCDACDNSNRWTGGTTSGGGTEMDPVEARERVLGFHDGHSGLIKGGFISKMALDSIFCHHTNYNGIYCYIAADGHGNQFMVIEGWEDKDASGRARVEITLDDHVTGTDKFKVFRTELMCPTVCGYCGE